MEFGFARGKERLDKLFLTHAVISVITGLFAFLLPHAFEGFFIPHLDDVGPYVQCSPALSAAMVSHQLYTACLPSPPKFTDMVEMNRKSRISAFDCMEHSLSAKHGSHGMLGKSRMLEFVELLFKYV